MMAEGGADDSATDNYEGTYNVVKDAVDNKGGRFEYKMATLLYLRGLNYTENFQLSTNNSDGGKFDDIVYRFLPRSQKIDRRFYLQLKHKVDDEHIIQRDTLSKSKIRGKTNPFFLEKYFESYCKMEGDYRDTYFIIFTNASVQQRPSTIVSNIDPEVQNILNTGGNQGCFSMFDFNADDDIFESFDVDELTKTKLQDFLSRLIFFSNQCSESQLDLLIRQELIIFYNMLIPSIELVTLNLTKQVENWWEPNKNKPRSEYLTKNWTKWKEINDQVISDISGISHVQFKHAEVQSLGKEILHSSHEVIHVQFTGECVELKSTKLLQVFASMSLPFFLYISVTDSWENLEMALKLLVDGYCDVLVVDVGADSQKGVNFSSQVGELLYDSRSNGKKLVLASGSESSGIVDTLKDHMQKQWKQKFPEFWKNVRTNCSVLHLDDNTQDQILQRKLTFQGYEKTFSDLGQSQVLQKCLHGKELSYVLNNKNEHIIGNKLEEDYDLYVKCKLRKPVTVKKDILNDRNEENILFMTELTGEQRINCTTMDSKVPIGENIIEILLFDSKNFQFPNDQFRHMMNTRGKKDLHWLENDTGTLKWLRSCGNTRWLYQHIMRNDSDEENTGAAVLRKKTSLCDVEDVIRSSERTIVVVGEPGMGKSVLLTHVANKTKKIFPSSWVIKLNLHDITKPLYNMLTSGTTTDNVFCVLADAARVDKATSPNLAKELLKNSLDQTGNIVVLLDAYDEISPKYSAIVLNIIEILLQSKLSKLWITTRPVMQSQLEERLSVQSYSCQDFTNNQQIEFVYKFWSKKPSKAQRVNLRKTAEALLTRAHRDIPLDRGKSICSVPLHTMILAETYEERALSGHLDMKSVTVNLPELYEKFIEQKMVIYFRDKIAIDHTQPESDNIICKRRTSFMEDHQLCALSVILSSEDLSELQLSDVQEPIRRSIKDIYIREGRPGVIVKIINDQPFFIHQTFVEYFVALWFIEHREKYVSAVETILFEPRFDVVRNVFDHILAEKRPLHLAVLNKRVKSTDNFPLTQINDTDSGGRSALHLAVQRDGHFEVGPAVCILLLNRANIEVRDTIFGFTPMYYAAKVAAWETVRLLLTNEARVSNNIASHELVQQVLEESVKQKYIGQHEFDTYKCFEMNWSIFNRRDIPMQVNILHLAVLCGHLDCFQLLLSRNADINSCTERGNSVLSLASEGGNDAIVNILLQRECDVNSRDFQGYTSLHFACKGSNVNVVKLLLLNGANTLFLTNAGRTALHESVKVKNTDIVNLLLEHGCEECLKIADKGGYIPLHLALNQRDELIAKLLYDKRSSVLIREERGTTLLHEAVEEGKFDLVRQLLNSNIDVSVNEKDENGYTPLYLAFKHKNKHIIDLLLDVNKDHNPLIESVESGNLEMVKLIFESGADFDVNSSDNLGCSVLNVACKNNQQDIVKMLIENGAKLTYGAMKRSPLHEVSIQGNFEITKLLLDIATPGDVNTQDMDKNTPMHVACKHGHVYISRLLLEKGANIGAKNNVNRIPLHEACEVGNRDIVNLLLSADKKVLIDSRDNNDDTPLHLACRYRNLQVVNDLLGKGAHVMSTYKKKLPVFHEAVRDANLVIVHLLMENCVDIDLNKRTSDGFTTLHFACRQQHEHITTLLIQRGAEVNVCSKKGISPLHEAIKGGNTNIVSLLIDKGASLDVRELKVTTPLHLACKYGRGDVVSYFLDKGGDVKSRDTKGFVPLHDAVLSGHKNTVQLLLNVDVYWGTNAQDVNGNTPLHLACICNYKDITGMLIDNGANVNIKNKNNRTPLHEAAQRGHQNIAELLLRPNRIDVNASDKDGCTALIDACKHKHLNIVRLLVEKGADATLCDKSGGNCLHQAVEFCHEDIVKVLLDSCINIDLNARDEDGRTAHSIACTSKSSNICRLLENRGATEV